MGDRGDEYLLLTEFGTGNTNANCPPDFQKTLQNSPKHITSSKKFNFFWGGASLPQDPNFRPMFIVAKRLDG